ncbi:MAG: hypothetical protein ACW98A_07600 [Candidatus Hodarchaeales archaeon]|jgi:hypothetical protein
MKKRTIDINIRFKEKNLSPQDYKAVTLAWLKSQAVFRDTLKQLEDKKIISLDLLMNIIKKFNLSSIDEKLEELRSTEVASSDPSRPSPSSSRKSRPHSTSPSMSDSLTPISPSPSTSPFSKDALKDYIVKLAKQQDQPNYNYDELLNATGELLNHPDITSDEKDRYQIYYQELNEYVNIKNVEKQEISPISSQSQLQSQMQSLSHFPSSSPSQQQPSNMVYPENRSTSISQVRYEMAQKLKQLREIYNVPQD